MKFGFKHYNSMNFKEVYKFPLHNDWGIVFDFDYNRAFDFANRSTEDGLILSESSQNSIVSAINGKTQLAKNLILSYNRERSTIYTEVRGVKQELISIRGWGYLTGTGGLNLPEEEAAKIQDDFAEYIIDRLEEPFTFREP